MARITIIPDTRFRTSPNDANLSNVIGSNDQGPLTLEGAVRDGDWWRVPVELHIRADRAAEVSSDQRIVPWYSQLGIGRKNACGPACDAMLLEWITGRRQDVAQLSRESDPTQDGTTSDDLVRLAARHGARLRTLGLKNAAPVPILPAICLVKYIFDRDRTYYDPFYGWHWLVLLAYDNDEVVCHDPLFPSVGGMRGAFVRYKMSEWVEAFAPYEGVRYAVVPDASKPGMFKSLFAKPDPVSPRSDKVEVY